MKSTLHAVRLVLVGSGALALLLGLILWINNGTRLTLTHELLGYTFFLSLWTIAVIAARFGVSLPSAAAGAVWGLIALILAIAQREILPGSWHWTIRVLHVATALGAIVWGRRLATQVPENDVATGARPLLPIDEAAAGFLAMKRIAVTGVSRKPSNRGSNIVYQHLRQRNYQVFAVNPNASQVEGDRCFRDLKSIPGGVEAVVIATRPEHAMGTLRECADLGIRHVWMHRSFGTGSVSGAAAAWGRQHGIRVIDGGCPLMFGPNADAGHKFMCSLFTLVGHVPRRVS